MEDKIEILDSSRSLSKHWSNRSIEEFQAIVGRPNLEIEAGALSAIVDNTLGLPRIISGVIYPGSVNEVSAIVTTANKYNIKLYPISKGKNLGYGCKAPVEDNQLIVDLSRMNRIHEYDDQHGYVVIEPGVTQYQLYRFLEDQQARFCMDVTGAGYEASLVGNYLEGGFGHSPKGNHRRTFSDLEMVLGNGKILTTGRFPALGPDLSGIFVQSNFAIVTSMRIELFRKPERVESFVLQVWADQDPGNLIEDLSDLRSQGTLTNLAHVANALRVFETTRTPETTPKTSVPLKNSDAVSILSSPLLKCAYWNVLGGLYGTKKEVKAKKSVLRKKLSCYGSLRFFDDHTISIIEKTVNLPVLKEFKTIKKLKQNIASFKNFHGLLKGIPSQQAFESIYGHVAKKEDLGLIFICPAVEPRVDEIQKTLKIAQQVFDKYLFEMPVTIILAEQDCAICCMDITFDKSISKQAQAAHSAYQELSEKFHQAGISLYRSSILGMKNISYPDEREEFLSALKNMCDPNNIISPGRYNINP